jgi:hypothetical protein
LQIRSIGPAWTEEIYGTADLSETENGLVCFAWRRWPGSRIHRNLLGIRQCQNYVAVQNGTVSEIALKLDYEVTVSDLVTEFGTPTAIQIFFQTHAENAATEVMIHYPEQGVSFRLEDFVYGSYPEIEPMTRVADSLYITPLPFDAWLASRSDRPSFHWFPWPGYGPLREQTDNARSSS